jgi:hypothetical protein
MKKDTIIQFVGFITNLGFDQFVTKWEQYARRLINGHEESTLLQEAETKSKFRYVSQHEWPDQDFKFNFMNANRSEHFPEHNVKVVQVGGYTPLQMECSHGEEGNNAKLIAFISHDEMEIDFYRKVPSYKFLNIYQSYYESCTYGYVLEYFIPHTAAAELLDLLKRRSGVEIVRFKECLVPQV